MCIRDSGRTITMGLKTGIVGLPNVGKSTLFNALTEDVNAEAANYPFCTIEPNVGVVSVPDERLSKLSEINSSEKTVPTSLEFKEFDEFLLARAMEHDSPTLLFRLACEYLISVQVIRPGPVTVLERVAHARAEAQRETYDRLAHEFTEQRCAGLDGLLVVDPAVGMTRLRWLSTAPVEASPAGIKAEVTKLEFLRGLGAEALDLSMLPAERCRFLATVGRRLTAQALERREPQRRYPILLTLLAQSATDVLDECGICGGQGIPEGECDCDGNVLDALNICGGTCEADVDEDGICDEVDD